MKKTIIGLFLLANLHAISYGELLEKALKNNASLQINKSQEQRANLEGQIETRRQNPNIEFEVADFSSKRLLRENAFGTRVGISQSLLLPSVKEDKKTLAQSRVEVEKQSFELEKSEFIYRFNMHYLAFREAVEKEQLQQEALEISKKIRFVVEGRFNAGSIAKSEVLQARIEEHTVLNQGKQLSLESLRKNNALLRFANVQENTTVSSYHNFNEKTTTSLHPFLSLTEKKEEVARAELAVASHTMQSIELFSEIEAEPDQDIFRVGISIPLPIFNKNSQEKQLAKIEINNQKLALASAKRALDLELAQLQNEITEQEALKVNYESLAEEENRLLRMYQQGYRLAKVNLLKLSNIKKELLRTKENLLATRFSIEKNIIKINYLKGAYNE
jgi:cobalt-zinc-cadmium efflux system outer membrane protein